MVMVAIVLRPLDRSYFVLDAKGKKALVLVVGRSFFYDDTIPMNTCSNNPFLSSYSI